MPTALTRWDPFQELANMRTTLDRFFGDQGWRMPGFRNGDEMSTSALAVDVAETPDAWVVEAAVPGVDPKDINIQVEEDVLTISGQFESKQEQKDTNYLRRELRYGSFERSLRLPPTVDAEHAEATFEHGMLKLRLPKKPEAKARTIKITPKGVIEAAHEGQGQQN
jgi:HSP20 family protein